MISNNSYTAKPAAAAGFRTVKLSLLRLAPKPSNTCYQHQTKPTKQSGFTIIELLMSVTIMGILASVAVPSFASMVKKNRVTVTANHVHLSLTQARNHAINTNTIVQICQLAPNSDEQCNSKRVSNTNWANGWLIYADLNSNNNLDSGDSILTISQPTDGTKVIFNQRGRLRFFPDGSARSAGFYICQDNTQAARHVRLLHTGRARVSDGLGSKQRQICNSTDA